VATGVSTNLNQLVATIQKVMGTNIPPVYKTPAGKIRATASSNLYFSNEKIKKMLGWEPLIPLEEGIRRIIAWCRTQSR